MAQVSIRELDKKYDNGFHAVGDVSLEVRVKAHEPLRFALDPEQLYFFDGESEAAI